MGMLSPLGHGEIRAIVCLSSGLTAGKGFPHLEHEYAVNSTMKRPHASLISAFRILGRKYYSLRIVSKLCLNRCNLSCEYFLYSFLSCSEAGLSFSSL